MSGLRKQKGNQSSSPKRQTSSKKGNSLAAKSKKHLESAAEISTTETDDRTPESPKVEDRTISGDTNPVSADVKNVDESTRAEIKQSDCKNEEFDKKLDNTTLDATEPESTDDKNVDESTRAEIKQSDCKNEESDKKLDNNTLDATEPESTDDKNVDESTRAEIKQSDCKNEESDKKLDNTTLDATEPESTDDKIEDESTRAQIKQTDDKNVESDMKLDNTTLDATEATDESNGTNKNEIPRIHPEPSEDINENDPESAVNERGQIISLVQKNDEQNKNYNGEDNENSELIETISKTATEISSFTEKSVQKERESLLQNAPVSDVEIVIKEGAIHIIMVQNGDRNSHQKYSLKVKGISNENDFHSQNVVSSSIVEKDREEKKICQKCELVNKQSIAIVKEKDNDKIKITKDLKKEENGEVSEIKQEERSIPEKKYPDVADGEEKSFIITADDELINQPIKGSINTVGEEERNIVTNEMLNRVDPEKEQAERRSPEKQLVQDVYTESEQVNEPNKESNGVVGGEKSDNRTNGTLEKGDPEMKEEGPSSLEKKQPGVLNGEENVTDPGIQPNNDSTNKVAKEETNKKINESLNTKDTDMEQEKNVSPVYRQLGIQNGGEIVNKASELSIIKTELEKQYALNDGVMDEEGSSNASWNEIDPLRFHTVHGANVRLSANGFVAQRHKLSSFFGKGIVFSSRPVGIGEKICIRFEEISNYWLGFMTFGFTNHDPETLACDLPGIAITDLDKKPGFWAGHLAKTFCNKGNIFHYFVNSSGNVNFGINGIDKGTLFWNVDTTKPIWALNDLFGYFTAISLVDPRILIETRSFTPYKENKDFGITSWITASLHPSLKYQKGIKLLPMNLHSTKGMNVQMLNFKGVVARSDDTNQGYIFTECPMYLGQTIVIQVLASSPGYEYLPIGLTCNDPATVNPRELPDNAEGLAEWGQNWVLIKNIANFVQHRDEIAVTRTVDGDIRLRRNDGESVTVARFSRAQKFWAFVDIFGAIKMLRVWTTKRPCPCIRQTSKNIFN